MEYYLIGWLIIGIIKVKFTDGWIIMITDSRNVKKEYTWLAFPILILAWIFWPFNIGRLGFLFVTSL